MLDFVTSKSNSEVSKSNSNILAFLTVFITFNSTQLLVTKLVFYANNDLESPIVSYNYMIINIIASQLESPA